jgi:hypothetical protein
MGQISVKTYATNGSLLNENQQAPYINKKPAGIPPSGFFVSIQRRSLFFFASLNDIIQRGVDGGEVI